MDLARLTYNNLVEDNAWQESKKKVEREEKNYLTLVTEILNKTKNNDNDSKNGQGKRTGGMTIGYAAWRFDNPSGDATKVVRGTTLKWCTNDCHAKPMWCGRRVCLGKAEFAAKQKKTNDDKGDRAGTKVDASKDFRIALAALTSEEDFAALERQFFQLKD